ncbi:hypothetical protein MNY66_16550 (plasmid) [Moellerella wisconsensis]|uniref:Uncharacterized protein n=1 Tax=Moellerella wisconsensis TaxID=158849 RepID=A0ACD3YCT0_9GAMM|nr:MULTISPECIES: hypothetical protein [Morganellaceae]QCJ72234.1 hypothetical protein C9446_20755 [Providencia heimbachae]UNH40653.1 hypothetical protein MNY70_17600 [Moellerella wisconsensis]UNH44357.1 hypothetical protein MNY66_16550 [Moellerella wisconsensis]
MNHEVMGEEQLIDICKYEPENSPLRIIAEEVLARRKDDRETSPESVVLLWDRVNDMDKEQVLEMLSMVCRKYTKLHGRYCDALQRAGELSVKLVALQGETDE